MTIKKQSISVWFIVFFIFTGLAHGQSHGDWPMFRHDAENSGYNPGRSQISISNLELLDMYESSETFLSPVVADIDKDDTNEIVIASREGNIYAFKTFSEKLWVYKTSGRISTSPAIGDLDNDNKPEVIVAADNVIYALSSKGIFLWKFSANAKITSPPKIALLDNDTDKEIIFGSEDGKLHVLDNSGGKIMEFKTQGSIESSPAVADINNDGRKDIVFGSKDNRLYVVTPPMNGKPLHVVGMYLTQGDIISSPAVADVDFDGRNEIVFGSSDGNIYCLGYWEIKTEKRKYQNIGTGYYKTETTIDVIFEKKWSYKTNDEVVSSPAIADINNDGILEAICGSIDRYLYVFNGWGKKIYGYTTSDDIVASVAVADLDNDGKKEIIVASLDGKIYVINSTGYRLWEYKTSGKLTASPVVADINGDGKMEIIVISENRRTYVFGEKRNYIKWEMPKATTTTIYHISETKENSENAEDKKTVQNNETTTKNESTNSEELISIISNSVKEMGGSGLLVLVVFLGFIAIYISYRRGVSEGAQEKIAEDEKIVDIVLKERMQQKTNVKV